VYGRVAFYKKNKKFVPPVDRDGVSIVICVRNEKDLLEKNLPLFLAQNYPNYEVVLVNDCSEDDSELLLGVMKAQYINLEVRHIPKDDKFQHGKPMALGVGIKAAKYDWLVFADIDCTPHSEWLSRMRENFTAKTSVVLGYASYPKASKLIRCDIFYSALHYLGFALMKKPYMANGKNYAYRRKLFFDSKGFDIRMTREREDIVFVNKITNKTNTLVELRPSSFIKSSRQLTYKDWIQYKKERKASFRFYGSKKKHPAFLNSCSILLFAIAIVLLCTHGILLSALAGVFLLIHLISLIIVLAKACKKLMERRLFTNLLFYSILMPFVSIMICLQRNR
jgi:glycosyltransferase involved in cell wall biosynthesis